jgi:hypothetical protein
VLVLARLDLSCLELDNSIVCAYISVDGSEIRAQAFEGQTGRL